MLVTALTRYAVKGLSGDALASVELHGIGETFPDDRRYALLQRKEDVVNVRPGDWLHKENFLCAFTAPEMLSRLRTSYSIKPVGRRGVTRRLLTVRDRGSGILLVPELDLALGAHRERLQDFMREYSGRDVVCVTADDSREKDDGTDNTAAAAASESGDRDPHRHQFGNTSSAFKQRGDTRTLHIVSQQTVDALSDAISKSIRENGGGDRSVGSHRLRPSRFRPNIVVDCGPTFPPFGEFEWVGRQLRVVAGAKRNDDMGSEAIFIPSSSSSTGLILSVISKTVRCRGVSVDPDDDPPVVLDIPGLIVDHFPTHGPYLGVYAVVDHPGQIAVNDCLEVVPLN